MSEDFKEKLRRYSEGSLPGEEREEMERELAKMEAYQTYLDELMGAEETPEAENGGSKPRGSGKKPGRPGSDKKIIRRGKWRARIANTFTVLSALLIITVLSSIITSVFYETGARRENYRDVVSSALAVSRPNTSVQLNGSTHVFFTTDFAGKLVKRIGDEQVTVGDYSLRMLLGRASISQYSWLDEQSVNGGVFYYPRAGTPTGTGERWDDEEWGKLEKLPEGTVAEVYLSFDQLFTTDQLLQKFEGRNMEPVWFAADTGPDAVDAEGQVLTTPLGFPYQPIWHADDMIVQEVKETKAGWFGMTGSRSVLSSSPPVESYGSGELREENFMKTLYLMQEYKSIAAKVAPFIRLDESVSYLEENGVRLYGAVVTGPVKELLKLREEPRISHLRVGEVRLWNWRDRDDN
ncbi:hypothetical protein GCM10010912_29140 [Paenibacillus albidus]|uniref:Sigma factor regulator C-terminal domain-containing protein n=1 Tax=Paenibacillus albidus TaxID=2041023 RepID=A0A917CAL3_9BACL|nr:anti-sigma factor [Paenibacillus albidus]GGF82173.1 hypothetical protein GCM10010912_29140 [Paenibacillus albidus]